MKRLAGPKSYGAHSYRGRRVLVAASLFLGLCGCGSLPHGLGATTASPARMGSPTPQSTPSIGYVAYTSQAWKYSFEYPANWFSLPDATGRGDVKDFASQNIASPEQMQATAIWLSVLIDAKQSRPCASSGSPAPSVVQQPASVDGAQTTKYISSQGVLVVVAHTNWCYTFSFITSSLDSRDQHTVEIDHILSSFRFNR